MNRVERNDDLIEGGYQIESKMDFEHDHGSIAVDNRSTSIR